MSADQATEVLVIGGGATGTGVARDLALRGVDVTLVERGRLTAGTTGRMHGLLHSGARYADTDPESAVDCLTENRILREIATHCIEETGGLFVHGPEEPEGYVSEKIEACRACGIPTTELTGEEARSREPALASDIDRAVSVPDAAVDPFRLVVANALDAEAHGARIETHTEVTDVLVEADRVVGVATCTTEEAPNPGERGTIRAEYVVNATGAWAGQIADFAGCAIDITPSKGAMVVTQCRQIDTVINRCAPRGDADIIVPHETTALLGTTDVVVDDADDFEEAAWEVELLIDRLSTLVPLLAEARTLRSYWGVRPLYDPGATDTGDPSGLTRDYAVIDHEAAGERAGFVSVVGGKFATYRLMAEDVSDHVCERLGVADECTTADRPLPGSEDPGRLDDAMDAFDLRSPIARRSRERLGSRAETVLDRSPNPVLCACEAVTRAEVADALSACEPDLNGVRIRTRAAMGTCQGAICSLRLATELHPQHDVDTVTEALDRLFEERWKGQRHALWGEQLSQAMLGYALHATTMNRDRDSGFEKGSVTWDQFEGGEHADPD